MLSYLVRLHFSFPYLWKAADQISCCIIIFWWQLLQGSSEFIPAGHVSYVPQIESNGSQKQNSLQMFTLNILMLAYTWMNQQMNEWMKEWMNELVSEWVSVCVREWVNKIFIYLIKLKNLENPYYKWDAQQYRQETAGKIKSKINRSCYG